MVVAMQSKLVGDVDIVGVCQWRIFIRGKMKMSNGKYSGRKKASESAHKILVVTRIFIFIWILFIWLGSDAIQNEWKQLQMQLLGRLYRSEMVNG